MYMMPFYVFYFFYSTYLTFYISTSPGMSE